MSGAKRAPFFAMRIAVRIADVSGFFSGIQRRPALFFVLLIIPYGDAQFKVGLDVHWEGGG